MKIAVLVKQVPGSESPLPTSHDEKWVDEDKVAYIMNESDNYALEEALQIKESLQDSEVVAVSLGPERVKKVIREALAKGADRGIHIQMETSGLIDPLSTATIFAETLKSEDFDLIFTGLQSDDLGNGQIGVILGEMLHMSTATLAVSTEVSESKIKIKQELEAGYFQNVTMSLPASITIQSGLNTPRYPSLKGIMGAKKKEIITTDLPQGNQFQSISKVYAPTSDKQTVMLEGSPDEIVDKLINAFRSEIKIL